MKLVAYEMFTWETWESLFKLPVEGLVQSYEELSSLTDSVNPAAASNSINFLKFLFYRKIIG